MIEITKYNPNYGTRSCNVCNKKDIPLHIVNIGNEHGGMEMVLCNYCLSKLYYKIGQYMTDCCTGCKETKDCPQYEPSICDSEKFIDCPQRSK